MIFEGSNEDLMCPWTLDDDEFLIKNVTLEAGRIALDYFMRNCAKWEKSPNNPVSEADLAVDDFLRTTLMQNRTGYGWLSEETMDRPERLSRGRVWIVDPIDGTRAFLQDGDDWCISVALVQNRRPVIAALYAPVKNAFYFARIGCGATKNDYPIKVTETNELDKVRMMGMPDAFKNKTLWPDPWPDDMYCERVNSIALRMAQVADGQFDCCVTLRPKNDWDVAAADLIVQEAGGVVTTGYGGQLEFNHEKPMHKHIVATTPTLQEPVLDKVIPALGQWRSKFTSVAP